MEEKRPRGRQPLDGIRNMVQGAIKNYIRSTGKDAKQYTALQALQVLATMSEENETAIYARWYHGAIGARQIDLFCREWNRWRKEEFNGKA